jgi:isoaspartyl peptidase/L-asparaginase-like protein (Ntn-hydrolase superfamily)
MSFKLAIHGGAGVISRCDMSAETQAQYESALEASLKAGHAILAAGGTAIDAVEAAVRSMEDCPLFNAGKGAVFTHSGIVEMDASIMCGKSGQVRSVLVVTSNIELHVIFCFRFFRPVLLRPCISFAIPSPLRAW